METVHEVLKCDYCDKEFKTISTLTFHRKKNHQIKIEYKCSICEKLFFGSSNLKKHNRNVHSIKDNRIAILKCNICGNDFVTHKGLREHKNWKHKTGEIVSKKCDICEKKFFWSI